MASTIENVYQGDGYNFLFPFTFQYVQEEDVKVSLNDVDTNEYSLSNATTVQLNAAPPVGTIVRVYRQTDTTAVPATFYSGSTITAKGLNDNFSQTLFVAQEVQKAQEEALATSSLAQAAIDQADSANTQSLEAIAAANVAISTANATTSTAAEAQANSTTALNQSNTALTTAQAAETNIQASLDASAEAVEASDAVVGIANQALTASTEAVNTANAAAAAVVDGPVVSVNGQTGVVVITLADISFGALQELPDA